MARTPVLYPARTVTAMTLLGVNAVGHPGGAEIALLRLVSRLRKRGWDITLSSPDRGTIADAGHPWLKLDVGGLGAGEGARAVASWPRALRLAQRFDVVYLNSTVCGRLLPALRGTRSVLHVHDIVDRVPRHWHSADVVLADSEAVAERLDGLEAHVVYGPIELDPPPAPPPWSDGPGPVVGFVGRIEPRKGVTDLLAAAPLIREQAPQARIVVVGDDPYGQFPEYVAEVRAATDVEHVPWIDNAPGVMRHLDVLVAPSHQESFGTVLSEAMAVGTPVVATAVGGLTEVVEDGVTGILVRKEDPAALARAVLEVLSRRDEMGAAARRAAARFGADAYAERVEALVRPPR
jgi:glycosyltransferase involved in cell wall biosynthesis